MEQKSTTGMRRSRPIALACTAATLLAGACLVVQPASPAFAATSHSVKISLKEAPIFVTEGPLPGPPELAKEAGLFVSTIGSGANRTDVRVIDGKGTRTFFTRHGSFWGSFVFTGVRKSNGETIVGTLTITGGSGKYAGAHGKLHINGFHYDTSGYSTEHLRGSLTY